MSNLITMAIQTVKVTWTKGNNWSFEPNGLLVRSQNLTVFVYALTPESTPGVAFASEKPVVWHHPPVQPENLGFALLGNPGEVIMTDLNTATAESSKSYSFFLQVELDGEIYRSPDPTIVNTEPPHFVPDAPVEPVDERPILAA